MPELLVYQYVWIALIFGWSGFVRSGIGFGGTLFALPFLLLIHDQPLFFMPIIGLHVLFFAAITVFQAERLTWSETPCGAIAQSTINWRFVGFSLAIMALPKLAGVVGLLLLPSHQTALLIYLLVALYAISYIIDRPLKSTSKIADVVFLMLGAYVSGISLIGAPLIIPVALRHVAISEFRNTLFVVWWVLVSIKLVALASADIDLQITAALMLLPFAGVGHALGMRFHQRMMQRDSAHFFRLIGWVLLAASAAGLTQLLFEPLQR